MSLATCDGDNDDDHSGGDDDDDGGDGGDGDGGDGECFIPCNDHTRGHKTQQG